MKKITKIEEFEKAIEKKVLVDFYADWCGPCRMMEPILEEIEKSYPNIEIIQVNVDNFQSLAKKYSVISIPNLKIIENKKIVKEKTGLMTANELSEWLNEVDN